MQSFVALLIFCFLVFLFCVYIFSHDDFVLMRRNVSLERVFNLAFLTALVGLFFARFFYVLFHFHLGFLNPLVFFLFPYFPGLELTGGVVGAVLFLQIFSFGKLPKMRLFDIFSLSFLCALSVGILLHIIFLQKTIVWHDFVVPLLYLALFILSARIFLRVVLKDGSLGLLFLLAFSLISFVVGRIKAENKLFLSNEDFILIEMFLLSLVFLLKQENLLARGRKPKQ